MITKRPFVLALAAMTMLLCLAGCGDETVYDWQRPHDTYLVGSFTQSAQAESFRTKLQRSGYDCRTTTELKSGTLHYNVLVDIYDTSPDTLSRLEAVTGGKAIPLKSTKSGSVSKNI
jgi:hypothetical protein